jgi:LysM repeat protein
MTRAKRYFARLLAVLAIAAVVIAVIVIVSNADLGKDESGGGHKKTTTTATKHKKPRTKAKTYTVKSGDTLTSISAKTGIPVSEIQVLNPEVDPQILEAGETLKLKK